jgi:hypothetical protein
LSEHRIQDSPFLIDEFDTEFSARTTAAEWERILEMRNQSNFVDAILQYHKLLPRRTSGNAFLSKLIAESGRYEILGYTLYLYDTRDPAQLRSGLTVTNLEKLCAQQKSASPGRVRAIIGLMWAGGYLKRIQSRSDSRVTHFEPTPKLMDIVEGWNHEIFKTIDAVFPDGQFAERHLSEPRFGWNMRKHAIEQLLTGWRPFSLFPEVYHFVAHDAGWMLLIHCIGKALQTTSGATIAPVGIDLAEFGAKFAVSRSHLRRLLESAYGAGLLDAPPQNGSHVALSRKLVAAYLMSMAFELQFYRRHALTGV